MSESLTLPCPSCGAALPVEPTAPAATCHYCRQTVAVPADLRRLAIEHAARVGAAQRKADQEASWIGQHRAFTQGGMGPFLPVLLIIPVMIGIGILANVLSAVLPREVVSVIMPITLYGSFGGFAYYTYRRYRKSKVAAAPAAIAASTCSRCGGPLTFTAGSAAAVCHACNATAVAGKTIQGELADAMERRARDLEHERIAAERQTYRTVSGAQRFGRYYLLIIAWPFPIAGILSFFAGADRLVTALASGKARAIEAAIGPFVLGSAMLCAVIAVATGVYYFVIRPARASGAALRDFAARLGGHVHEGGTTAAIDWLDRFWPGPTGYEVMIAQQEMFRYTLFAVLGRTPVMIVVLAGGTNVQIPRFHVRVASPRRRDERAALASPAARALTARGFTVKASTDGVELSHPKEGRAQLDGPMLGWTLQAAVAVAEA